MAAAAFHLAFVIVAASTSAATNYSSSISTWPSAATSFTITTFTFAPASLSSPRRV